MPSSRLMMAAWQVRPPRLVTMAPAVFMIGSQSGSVMSVTSTSPARKSWIWLTLRRMRVTPWPILAPTAWPLASGVAFSLST